MVGHGSYKLYAVGKTSNLFINLSSNSLVPHAFSCQVLVCFASQEHLFSRGEWANAAIEGCSEMLQNRLKNSSDEAIS